jgi:hypothetical protein
VCGDVVHLGRLELEDDARCAREVRHLVGVPHEAHGDVASCREQLLQPQRHLAVSTGTTTRIPRR